MKLHISHTTTYSYDQPVQYALQQLRLTPKSRQGQNIIDWHLEIENGTVELQFDDHNNNHVHLVSLEAETDTLIVTARGNVETSLGTGIIGTHGGYAPLWYFLRQTNLTKPGPLIRKLVQPERAIVDDDIEKLHRLSALILNQVVYKTGASLAETTAETSLENGAGVCQDHTHIFLSAARLLGYPARYVSGYLMLNDRIEQDATHAWAEVHVSGLGWVGFDISNGISPDERYVPMATGLDYREAAPITGMRVGGNSESMLVNVQVQQ